MSTDSQVVCLPEPGRLAAGGAAAEERQLARGVACGDPASIAAAYDRYGVSLYRLLFALLGSEADAEDALQEVFARLASGRARRVSDLKAYLYGAVRNEAVSILRRRRREVLFGFLLPGSGRASPPADVARHSDLLACLQRLPSEQREVVALKVFEEMTFAEIALLVKAPPNTVAARYRYAILKLRRWCAGEDRHEP